ncbi:MAG: hypothetical protein Q9184_000040 [Pyrenodesmia sp. 2 TL-2023]
MAQPFRFLNLPQEIRRPILDYYHLTPNPSLAQNEESLVYDNILKGKVKLDQESSQSFEDLVDDMEYKIGKLGDVLECEAGEWSYAVLYMETGQAKKTWEQMVDFLKTHLHLRMDEHYEKTRMNDILVEQDCKRRWTQQLDGELEYNSTVAWWRPLRDIPQV